MNPLVRALLRGAAAGAAGTTALNTVSYVDMVIRARPASGTPEATVEVLSARTHVPVPGLDGKRDNRIAGLGPLTGLLAGIGAGAVLGALRGLGWRPGPVVGVAAATVAALVVGNGPMTALGITDPRSWSAKDWAEDVVPHLAYGAVTALVLDGLDGPPASRGSSERA